LVISPEYYWGNRKYQEKGQRDDQLSDPTNFRRGVEQGGLIYLGGFGVPTIFHGTVGFLDKGSTGDIFVDPTTILLCRNNIAAYHDMQNGKLMDNI
jgi:hypothetical protein